MGHNVQSQAGVSLSDVYDVKGGQSPIERLFTTEVPAMHEMGGTIQSERFSSFIRRSATGALAQNTNFDVVLNDLPAGVSRILGLAVITDVAGRAAFVQVSVRDPVAGGGREVPIFAYDEDVDDAHDIRIDLEGTPTNTLILVPHFRMPTLSMVIGPDQPQSTPDVAFRGRTGGFGAGTVEFILLLHLAFSAIGGVSSRGLPVPSW